ncbi:unnamed protein product [Acanthoscelides obtectus]|uniref:Uncharacterized protein n=1 Tax=Acanthoscelides obtectus TaxID=200917 RepID=A0A9P0PRV1_ACAOB|nr:unnamed protein product [Acanthoscelides obtectus]CAK1682262.1 hypothetical protein AOBTE_LOCUS33517 [Acanthoscelides obtectus]
MATHTSDAAIHAKITDGGLGIPELKRVVPLILLKRITPFGDWRRRGFLCSAVRPKSSVTSFLANFWMAAVGGFLW